MLKSQMTICLSVTRKEQAISVSRIRKQRRSHQLLLLLLSKNAMNDRSKSCRVTDMMIEGARPYCIDPDYVKIHSELSV